MIRFAIDENGNRVFIDDATTLNRYYCEECKSELMIKRGNERVHHFAHTKDSPCTDKWHYDMSYWHNRWQERFPENCREVVKEYKGKKHRADVLIEEQKTVYEFQHSRLNASEFKKRNEFYNNLGYKVVWLFDVVTHIENGWIYNSEDSENEWIWERPFKTFKDYIYDDSNVELYFQIEYPAKENERLQYILSTCKDYIELDEFYGVDGDYYYDHRDDVGRILHVVHMSNEDNDCFYVDQDLTQQEWIDMLTGNKVFKKEDYIDTIPRLWTKYKCHKFAIFKNIDNGFYVRIDTDPFRYHGHCYGSFSKNINRLFQPYQQTKEIYGCNEKKWIFIWKP